MLTQCTTPDAPFYGWDMAVLSLMESYGVDMPCGAMLTTGTLFLGTLLAIPVVGLALALQGRI